jgi:hypothetical protein
MTVLDQQFREIFRFVNRLYPAWSRAKKRSEAERRLLIEINRIP